MLLLEFIRIYAIIACIFVKSHTYTITYDILLKGLFCQLPKMAQREREREREREISEFSQLEKVSGLMLPLVEELEREEIPEKNYIFK